MAVHSTLVATTGQLVRGLLLGRRDFAGERRRESAEREERVTTNVMVRDMDVANPGDARRLEGRVQLAVDTTLVSALRCDGSTLPRCGMERVYPELAGPRGRARLLAGEVGGLSEETRDFLNQLARSKVREPAVLKRRVQLRPFCHAVPPRLSQRRCADGDTLPSHEGESTFRYAGSW